jgi:hypothetical protein
MNYRLKQIIKNKLSEDLSSVNIIEYNGSIWFIDAKSKYWYLELYKKTKTLWWRLDFFEDFFILFGMEQNEFAPIISEWVEEVLNGKVTSTKRGDYSTTVGMEEVLNCKVVSTLKALNPKSGKVEEVLNSKVASTQGSSPCPPHLVEEILNSEIGSTNPSDFPFDRQVEEALNGEVVSSCNGVSSRLGEVEEILAVSTYDSQLIDFILAEKVLKAEPVSTHRQKWRQENQVEEILNTKGFSHDFVQEAMVQELIKNMIDNVSPDSDPDYPRVEDVISHHNSSITE